MQTDSTDIGRAGFYTVNEFRYDSKEKRREMIDPPENIRGAFERGKLTDGAIFFFLFRVHSFVGAIPSSVICTTMMRLLILKQK